MSRPAIASEPGSGDPHRHPARPRSAKSGLAPCSHPRRRFRIAWITNMRSTIDENSQGVPSWTPDSLSPCSSHRSSRAGLAARQQPGVGAVWQTIRVRRRATSSPSARASSRTSPPPCRQDPYGDILLDLQPARMLRQRQQDCTCKRPSTRKLQACLWQVYHDVPHNVRKGLLAAGSRGNRVPDPMLPTAGSGLALPVPRTPLPPVAITCP